jgi:hypothetical protein
VKRSRKEGRAEQREVILRRPSSREALHRDQDLIEIRTSARFFPGGTSRSATPSASNVSRVIRSAVFRALSASRTPSSDVESSTRKR